MPEAYYVMNTQQEIWKPVIGGEGLYEVSNKGNIKILAKEPAQGIKVTTEYIMILKPNSKGYYYAQLRKKGKLIAPRVVHRIVAQAFIPNPENKPCINHINGIKTDNRIENLEWVTYKENSVHAYKHLNLNLNRCRGTKNCKSKRIINIETGKIYETITQAAEDSIYSREVLARKLTEKYKKYPNNTPFRYYNILDKILEKNEVNH